ncbi:MAG TPA: hypothetical protein VLT33_06835 [Labilithrix sp.]|nr:hypothetical protein [Labilithrix sp.]
MHEGRERRKRKTRSARNRAFQLICLLVAVALGLLILGKKVGAEPASHAFSAPGDPAPKAGAKDPAGKKPGKKEKDAGPDAAALAAAAAAAAEPKDAGPDVDAAFDPDAGGLDYAVLQGDEDFPKDMSEEEKNNIGTGKVPIHREGAYRSPLAHPRFGGPAIVKVGLVIREIREFSIQSGGFESDFFMSLTSDKEMPNLNLVFTNGHEVTMTALADTPTFKVFSVTGKFTTDVDLRKYPYDTQNLFLLLEDQKAGIDQIVFMPDKARTSLDSSFRLSSFGPAGTGAISYKHKYPARFDRDDLYVSRYKFTLSVDRFATSAAFSVFVPAFIIVLISLTGLWVPPDELEVRSNAGAPMLAAAVLFHFSLIQSLPATGYLTHADKLMLGVYLSLLLNMASTWMLMLGDERWMERVFKVARTTVPIATAIIMILAVVV